MTTRPSGALISPATKVVLKALIYYAVLIAVGAYIWQAMPETAIAGQYSIDAILGRPAAADPAAPDPTGTLAASAAVAMIAAVLLAIPVAWVYQLTRAKEGYQQSVVQLLIILPIVVAGIVVLVKFSLALAFSLAGIVAAVRFRNALDDSKDAVYVFLAIGIGLATAVDVPVAVAISLIYNAAVLFLWYVDFGNAPVELEGRIAERRLERARELARTGTFVARIDDEVLRNMTRDQLEGLAHRAWRRAHPMKSDGNGAPVFELRLYLRTTDADRTRQVVEPALVQHVKRWSFDRVRDGSDGTPVVEYVLKLKKKTSADQLLSIIRTAAGPELVDAELR
jgi:hypothetical protein